MIRSGVRAAALGVMACLGATGSFAASTPVLMPNGQFISPLFPPGARFSTLNPMLADHPHYRAGQAVRTALSPDGNTLLVLTSGYNRLNYSSGTSHGQGEPSASNEYIFVYDVSGANARVPVQTQVLEIPNSFCGMVWAPDGAHFYVSGGDSDAVFTFAQSGGAWAQNGTIALNHTSYGANLTGNAAILAAFLSNGIGYIESASAAGLAITPDGATLVVTNIYNESVSVIDTASGRVLWEYDLRPYNNTPALSGTAGGETPFGVAIAGSAAAGYTAFVSSLRDREVDAFPLRSIPPDGGTLQRIPLAGNPNNMVLSADGRKLYVAQDNSDLVSVINTATDKVIDQFNTIAIPGLLPISRHYSGAAPNGLAISPDGNTLYVTNGGANAVSVVDLTAAKPGPVALIPTGWYPHSVAVSRDGSELYVVNGKSDPGPNPAYEFPAANQYVLQLEKGGLQSVPVPGAGQYAALTAQVAANNNYGVPESVHDRLVMAQLHEKIQHVIYIIKENRTFDQVLGDLPNGANGDPKLTMFGAHITPSLHRMAGNFVTLDNFYCAGEVSGNGWPWSTEARESDFGTTTIPINYAGRGSSNNSEGLNRDVNVGLTTDARVAAFPFINGIGSLYEVLGNAFPGGYENFLPGLANDFATDGPLGTPPQQGYLWDSALRAGLSVRDYGMFIDIVRYNIPVGIGGIPLIENPYESGTQVAWSSNPTLAPYTDIYYRGFDNAYPDTWRLEEWYREFQQYEAAGNLPSLSLVRLMHDHTGNFCPKPYILPSCPAAMLDTPEKQEADNDYAVGRLVESVAHSPYASNTLIFVLEDDAQDGADHVDAHRSTAYVVGPYVRHRQVVSTRYGTVNMVRTIEDILGITHLNLNDANTVPMTDVFDLAHPEWTFTASASGILRNTGLVGLPGIKHELEPAFAASHDQDWWAQRTRGYDWSSEDRVPAEDYNRILWEGLKGK